MSEQRPVFRSTVVVTACLVTAQAGHQEDLFHARDHADASVAAHCDVEAGKSVMCLPAGGSVGRCADECNVELLGGGIGLPDHNGNDLATVGQDRLRTAYLARPDRRRSSG